MKWFTPIYNMDQYRDMKYSNKRRLDQLYEELQDLLEYPISPMLIRELSLARTLDCYDLLDTVNMLQYFNQLQGKDNEDIRHIIKKYIGAPENDLSDQSNR